MFLDPNQIEPSPKNETVLGVCPLRPGAGNRPNLKKLTKPGTHLSKIGKVGQVGGAGRAQLHLPVDTALDLRTTDALIAMVLDLGLALCWYPLNMREMEGGRSQLNPTPLRLHGIREAEGTLACPP